MTTPFKGVMETIFLSHVRTDIDLLMRPLGLLLLVFLINTVLSFWVKPFWMRFICLAFLSPMGILIIREVLHANYLIYIRNENWQNYLMLGSMILWFSGCIIMIFRKGLSKLEKQGMIGITLLTGGGMLLFLLDFTILDWLMRFWLLLVIPVLYFLFRKRPRLAVWCMSLIPLSFWILLFGVSWLGELV